jgi:biopolymer transport protein ExbB
MESIIEGGWVMLALLACSVVAVAIIVQKLILLKQTAIRPQFFDAMHQKLRTQPPQTVLKELQFSDHVEGAIASAGIMHANATDAQITAELAKITQSEADRLTSKMNLLSVIITTAPVFGLLGTVLGLMDVFSVIALEGAPKASLLSAGISKALVTTVAGLSLAIPLMFINQYLASRMQRQFVAWERLGAAVVATVRQPK